MDIQLWIIGQIAIDLLMGAVLLWVLVSGSRHKTREGEERMQAAERSEKILAEMNAIARDLEENLEEKRELTSRLLGRLDESLARAEKRYEQFQDLFDAADSASKRDTVFVNSSLSTKDAIRSLLSKGMSKEEVAQRLSISVGEIDLFLKLRDKGSKRRFSR
ncbi:MAG: hypothetical protein PVG49_01525 [Desulfobacteraceae bacterium]|jgi:predicted transcriptional regulator